MEFQIAAVFAGLTRTVRPFLRTVVLGTALALPVLVGSPGPADAGGSDCAAKSIRLPTEGALKRTAARFAARLPVHILAIGSSSTQGIGASKPAYSYPAQLETALEARFPGVEVTVVNAGVGGETSETTLARMKRQLAVSVPDLVIWQVGTNDALTKSMTEQDFESLVVQGAEAIEQAGADVMLVDQQYFKKIGDLPRYERFVAVLEKIAKAETICLFPRYRIMKAWDTEGSGEIEAMLASDGFHLNDRGYACVADMLATQIQSVIAASATH